MGDASKPERALANLLESYEDVLLTLQELSDNARALVNAMRAGDTLTPQTLDRILTECRTADQQRQRLQQTFTELGRALLESRADN